MLNIVNIYEYINKIETQHNKYQVITEIEGTITNLSTNKHSITKKSQEA